MTIALLKVFTADSRCFQVVIIGTNTKLNSIIITIRNTFKGIIGYFCLANIQFYCRTNRQFSRFIIYGLRCKKYNQSG